MLDALVLGLSDGSDSEGDTAGADDACEGEPADAPAPLPGKRARQEVTLEALQAHGYQGGPSVLLIREQQEEPGDWNW